MRFYVAVTLVALSGLVAGAALSTTQEDSYCQRLEETIEANESFEGQVACFAPEVAGGSASGEVANTTELRCTCHQSLNGSERTFNVRASSGTSGR